MTFQSNTSAAFCRQIQLKSGDIGFMTLQNGQALPCVPSEAALSSLDHSYHAAFIHSANFILVWEDDLTKILVRCGKLERMLLKTLACPEREPKPVLEVPFAGEKADALESMVLIGRSKARKSFPMTRASPFRIPGEVHIGLRSTTKHALYAVQRYVFPKKARQRLPPVDLPPPYVDPVLTESNKLLRETQWNKQ
jgi:hypothetical protein